MLPKTIIESTFARANFVNLLTKLVPRRAVFGARNKSPKSCARVGSLQIYTPVNVFLSHTEPELNQNSGAVRLGSSQKYTSPSAFSYPIKDRTEPKKSCVRLRSFQICPRVSVFPPHTELEPIPKSAAVMLGSYQTQTMMPLSLPISSFLIVFIG